LHTIMRQILTLHTTDLSSAALPTRPTTLNQPQLVRTRPRPPALATPAAPGARSGGHSGEPRPRGPCSGGTGSRGPHARGDRAFRPRRAIGRALRWLGPAAPPFRRNLRADDRRDETGVAQAASAHGVIRSERLDLILMPVPL